MQKRIVFGIMFSVLLTSLLALNMTTVKGSYLTQPKVFRLLAIEQMFDNYRMRSAQHLIKELLMFPNWNNSTDNYVSYIHLLSLYNYSEVFDDIKPFWKGNLSEENLMKEINFLANASPGEIVLLYYCGHSIVSSLPQEHSEFLGISPDKLRSWLNSTLSKAYLTLILDTCYSGYWIDFSPESTVLSACRKDQSAWGGDVGIFTEGLLIGFHIANDSINDGWISAKEVFRFAKNFTETVVTWDCQNPESYYSVVEGDLPLIQRDVTKPFPIWDVAVTSMSVNSLRVEPETDLVIDITVENQGEKPANFDVNVYANSSLISTRQVTLLQGESANLSFTWTAKGYGAYFLNCTVRVCPGEQDLSDNVYHESQIVIVAFITDMNLDCKVDMIDLYEMAQAFGSYTGSPKWNSMADIDGNGVVDMKDVYLVAVDFGRTYE